MKSRVLSKVVLFFLLCVGAYCQQDVTNSDIYTSEGQLLACPNECSDRGRCLNGICICDSSYTGVDCSKIIDRNTPDGFPTMTSAVEEWERTKLDYNISWSSNLKVCIVTTEIAGPVSNGGIGTAFSTLADTLIEEGHEVTVLFTKGAISQFGPFEDHVSEYRKKGIELIGLYRTGQRYIPRHLQTSYEVLRFMRTRDFDIVHLHDYEGAGYYSLLAKDQGEPKLIDKTFVLGTHGPNLWAKSVGNMEQIDKIDDLEMDFMERRCIQLTDVVISPSTYLLKWMSSEGWPLNKRALVQPNLLPYNVDSRPVRVEPKQKHVIKELVFFGRLETRKGIIIFCDAIDSILEEGQITVGNGGLEKVIFLGRSAMVEGMYGMQYVQKRAQKWGIPWKVISRLNSTEAQEYLMQNNRLAVMPSRIENSPYTVYECAHYGIPFIASNVGGIPDLLNPDDHKSVLFEPQLNELKIRLVDAIRNGIIAGRPIVDAEQNERIWMSWHQSIAYEKEAERRAIQNKKSALGNLPFVTVVITHFNRPHLIDQAVESVIAQDYPKDKYELLIMDDGSTDEAAREKLKSMEKELNAYGWKIIWGENCYLGCARNKAVPYAKGKYILFMDDDNCAKPHEVSTFVRAMESSNADILTSFVDFFWGLDRPASKYDRPSYIFLGGSADVGAFKNCFGDANSFVRVSSFKEIGGYTEDYGIGFEDWEMYANASLRGFKVDVVPEAVYNYRFTANSMQKTTNFYENRRRSIRPYLNSLPEALHDVILGAVFPRKADGSIAAPQGLAAQGTSRFPGATSSDGTPTINKATKEAGGTTNANVRPPSSGSSKDEL